MVRSALANAEDRRATNLDQLVVVDVRVDGGPMFKRMQPKAGGEWPRSSIGGCRTSAWRWSNLWSKVNPIAFRTGIMIGPGYSSDLGQEVDLIGGWTVHRGVLLEAGLGHFFRGDYVRESLRVVGSKDADYFYVQATLNL